ncbi:MAG: hypothetical protein AMXMBFR84_35090 [Candidatus Hydrogenedentota bacterium]
MIFELARDYTDAIATIPRDHPKRGALELFEEAIRRDIHFVERHPTTLFQCMWNLCWWYDCPDAAFFYREPDGGWPPTMLPLPWQASGHRLSELLGSWRAWRARHHEEYPLLWIRSLYPPVTHLGTGALGTFRLSGYVTALTFSPDSTRCAVCSANRTAKTGTVRIIDVADCAALTTIVLSDACPECLVFLPDGRSSAVGCGDETIRVYDVVSGACLRTLDAKGSCTSLCLRPNAPVLLSAGASVTEWSIDDWRRISQVSIGPLSDTFLYGFTGSFTHCFAVSIACHPTGSRIICGCNNGKLIVLDKRGDAWEKICEREAHTVYLSVTSPEGTQRTVVDVGSAINAVGFSPNGSLVWSGGGNGSAKLWHAQDLSPASVFCASEGRGQRVTAALSPDGCRLAVIKHNGRLDLFEMADGRPAGFVTAHEGSGLQVKWSPNGSLIGTAGMEGIRLWNAKGMYCQRTPRVYEGEPAGEITILPDGTTTSAPWNDEEWMATCNPELPPLNPSIGRFGLDSELNEAVLKIEPAMKAAAWFRVPLRYVTPHPNASVFAATGKRSSYVYCAAVEMTARGGEEPVPAEKNLEPVAPDRHAAMQGRFTWMREVQEVPVSREVRRKPVGRPVGQVPPIGGVRVGTFASMRPRQSGESAHFSPAPPRLEADSGIAESIDVVQRDRSISALTRFEYHFAQIQSGGNRAAYAVKAEFERTAAALERKDPAFQEWYRFYFQNSHLWQRVSVSSPEICFLQTAYAYAQQGAVARSVEAWLAKHGPERPWLRSLQRPLDPIPHPCMMTLEGHSGSVHDVAFLEGGRKALSASGYEHPPAGKHYALKVWDLTTGECLRTMEGHKGEIKCLAVLPDELHAFSGSQDKTIKLWDLRAGTCLRTYEGHEGGVTAVVSLPAGRFLSGSSDKTLKMWDVQTGECLGTFGHEKLGAVYSAATFMSGRRVVSVHERGILVANLETGSCDRSFNSRVRYVSVSHDGCVAVFGGDGPRNLHVMDLVAGVERITLDGHRGQLFSVALLPDNRHAVTGSGNEGIIKLWDLKNGKCLRDFGRHQGCIYALSPLRNGRRLLSSGSDRVIKMWDLDVPSEDKGEAHFQEVTSLAVSLDGGTLLSGSVEGTLKLWDTSSGACRQTISGNHSIWSLALLPDGLRAVSAGPIAPSSVKLWDLGSGDGLQMIKGFDIGAIAVIGGGRQVVTGSRIPGRNVGPIYVWDLTTQVRSRTLSGHTGLVDALAAFNNDRQLVSSGEDGQIIVWDLEKGTRLLTMTGHKAWVRSVAVYGDGHRACSGSEDKTVRLWDLNTGVCMRTLPGHHGAVWEVAVLADGRRAVSVSEDCTLRLWDLESGECLAMWVNSTPMTSCAVFGSRIYAGTEAGEVHFLELAPSGPWRR